MRIKARIFFYTKVKTRQRPPLTFARRGSNRQNVGEGHKDVAAVWKRHSVDEAAKSYDLCGRAVPDSKASYIIIIVERCTNNASWLIR
jgi:hypothetical protein